MRIKIFKLFLLSVLPLLIFATKFDELDKAPEGAYKGQIFFGGSLGLGYPFGNAIVSENDFISGTTYTFTENEITKEVDLVHLSFFSSLYAEYMPADHVGIKIFLDYLSIYQRTTFGSELENKNEVLYYHFGAFLGPDFHLTVRKPWDISFCPFIGYALGKYEAAVVAKELFPGFTDNTVETSNGLVIGSELCANFFFNGGVYFSVGFNWIYSFISASENLTRTTPSPPAVYDTPDSVNTINLIISFGYAYYN
ncbi:MAG: hypothetical protein JW982_02470 [Spirochaetes bacterium]|nr:hypothetical protein [Spirochaetota bacterium]